MDFAAPFPHGQSALLFAVSALSTVTLVTFSFPSSLDLLCRYGVSICLGSTLKVFVAK